MQEALTPAPNSKLQVWTWRALVLGMVLASLPFVWDWRWQVVWDARILLLKGLGVSWLLALMSVGFGALLAIPLALGRLYGRYGSRWLAVCVIELVRATPELMVVFWIFFTIPMLLKQDLSSWAAATIALSLIAAAYLAEVFRSGIVSVPKEQVEAAQASGLSVTQTFAYIVLPQALRNMAPAFIAQLAMLFKTTSLVYVIGVVEFFRTTILVNNAQYSPQALYLTMGIGYFFSCFALSWMVRRLDPRYVLTD